MRVTQNCVHVSSAFRNAFSCCSFGIAVNLAALYRAAVLALRCLIAGISISLLSGCVTANPASTNSPTSATSVSIQAPISETTLAAPSAEPVKLPSETITAIPGLDEDPIAQVPTDIDYWKVMVDGFAVPWLSMGSVYLLDKLYSNNPDFLSRALQRSAPYIHEIIIALKQRGMPTDLALLPVIESGFDPGAISPASAAGIWQFIPSTGQRYGLKQDWLRDERRDPLAATTAALDYLQTLYGMFGNWHLALAAYNCGENCVSRAIQRSQMAGGSRDFASIARFLPQETRDYVPRFIAVRNMLANGRSNGVKLPAIHNNPRITSIFINQPADLQSIARLSGTSYNELYMLNAGVLRQAIPATSSLIWLPENALIKLKHSIAELEKKNEAILLMNLKPAQAKPRETLKTFAERESVTMEQLRSINNIPASLYTIQSGTLFLPRQPGETIYRGDIRSLAPLHMVGEEQLRKTLENTNNKLLAAHPLLVKSSGWIPGRLHLNGKGRARRK